MWEKHLTDLLGGHAVAHGRAYVHGQLFLLRQGGQQGQREHAAGTPVQARPGPHLTPRGGGDDLYQGPESLGRGGQRPVHVRVAEYRPPYREPVGYLAWSGGASSFAVTMSPSPILARHSVSSASWSVPGRQEVGEQLTDLRMRHVGQMRGAGHQGKAGTGNQPGDTLAWLADGVVLLPRHHQGRRRDPTEFGFEVHALDGGTGGGIAFRRGGQQHLPEFGDGGPLL